MKKTLGVTGFKWRVTDAPANIIISIGSFGDIVEVASAADVEAKLLYSSIGESPSTVLGYGTCYVSTAKFASSSLVEIFLTNSDIEACLGRAFFVAIGLNEIFPNFSSILSVGGFQRSEYRYPTSFDRLFVELLYHDVFKLTFSAKEVGDFAEEHGKGLVAERLVQLANR